MGFLESLAIPVIEFNRRSMCFPTTHPLHLCFSTEPFVNEADVIVAIESDQRQLKFPPGDK